MPHHFASLRRAFFKKQRGNVWFGCRFKYV